MFDVLFLIKLVTFCKQWFSMSMSITIETDIVFPGKSDEDHCKKENNEEETTKDENNTDENTSNTLFNMKHIKKKKIFLKQIKCIIIPF